MARRSLWGAVGGGVGYSIGFPAGTLLCDAPALDRARVTTLQPHGLTDYLSRRDLAAEVTLGVIGLCVAAVGCRDWWAAVSKVTHQLHGC